jgi:ribosomal protein S18 acetylase RimI-like enzyme
LHKILNYTIKHITALETHEVRHPVLREGKPIESCVFIGDNLKTTIHLGLFSKEKPIGVCSFLKNKHHSIPHYNQFQLRGMAVLNEFQGKGLGQLLLKHGESELKKRKTKFLWCNARETAVRFYKKCGFEIIGEPFDIESVGLHYAMYKTL